MHDSQTNTGAPVSKGHRLWIPATIGALAAIAITIVRSRPELERNFKGWATSALVLLAAMLALLWFVFLSRFSWRMRLITVAALALSVFGFTKIVRVDGTRDGTGLPRLAWKWTSARTLRLDLPAPGAIANQPPANLPDVPQFFGPNRDGVIKGARLASDWKAVPPRELWRQPIGAGWSAFAAVAGRAFTQEQRGEKEVVACYDVLSGRLLWTHANDARFFQWQGGEGPRATPTVDRGQVVALGATGILDCLDASTGQLVWSRDVLKENRLDILLWGVSCSPLVFDDTVVVTGGLTDGSTLLAYRRSNGEPIWHSGMDKASYSSPILAAIAGRRVILSVNAASFTAHDPVTGSLLLDYPWPDGKWPKAAQPVVAGTDRVFISAGYGLGCRLLELSPGEGGKLTATELWRNLHLKTQFNSAAVRDGFLYGLDDGMLACVEIKSGDRKWKGGRYGSGQTLLVDDLVIVQSESGAVALAEAKPDGFQELGRIAALSSKTWNHPTLIGRYLLVRNDREVACYELPVRTGDDPPPGPRAGE